MSLPGRVAIGAVHVPSQLLGTVPRGTWCVFEELKAKSGMLIRKGILTGFRFLIFIKICFSSPGYKLRQCFQGSLIGAVTRLVISGNDE